MLKIENQLLSGERALFNINNASVKGCTFFDGESPLKESSFIVVDNCSFKWRYPLWYCHDITVSGCVFNNDVRAGIWYTNEAHFFKCELGGPKHLRRCDTVELNDCRFPDGPETLWFCKNVILNNVESNGDYFMMTCEHVKVNRLRLKGKYSFQNCKHVIIRDSYLDTKDAFWDCDHVEVYDSVIKGEYLGWNSKKITFVNCVIESLQGLCYVENLTLINCSMPNTTLAFEYCKNLDADVKGSIDSVKNITSGKLVCDGIGELIMDESQVDPKLTSITYRQ